MTSAGTGGPAASPEQRRLTALRDARARDSHTKRDRVLAVVRRLQDTGQRVTFAHTAREARVSTWFTYNNAAVRAAIQAAIDEQLEHGVALVATPQRERVSNASLQAELALVRHELADTRRDRDRFRARVQLTLGAELDDVTRPQLIERIEELERAHDTLLAQTRDAELTIQHLQGRLAGTQDELAAARTSLRHLIRSQNLGHGNG